MANGNSPTVSGGSQAELRIIGRVLNTAGVVFLSICVALSAALFEDLSAVLRTVIGLAIAGGMVAGGELISRRKNQNWWFPTTLMSAGYALAYFFSYSTYYVPPLRMLSDPYLTWLLALGLGAIGTWHGTVNSRVRWFTSVFTLMVTGHSLFHALSSPVTLSLLGFSVQVAALGCFFGMVWCGLLSGVYKRLESQYTPGASAEETANYWLHRVLHEAYFVFAALNAMALPLFISDLSQAPLWWSAMAPVLLAISWKFASYFKHGVVGVIWAAAFVTLLGTAYLHGVTIAVLLSVPVSGIAIGLAYRWFSSNTITPKLRLSGYTLYLYGGIAAAFLAPYLQFHNVLDCMPFWMVESLVICGLGLWLRDKFVHSFGVVAGLLSLGLFAWQYNTWTWTLVVPVVAASYGLSVAYAIIRRKGGLDQDPFLTYAPGKTISSEAAGNLETLWSWVGCVTVLAASFFLVDHDNTAIYWSLEALALIGLGFWAQKVGFRLQGLLAYGLAAGKLLGGLGGIFLPFESVTLFHAFQFGVLGASSLAASFLYFREEDRLNAQGNGDGDDTNGGGGSGGSNGPAVSLTKPAAPTENNPNQ